MGSPEGNRSCRPWKIRHVASRYSYQRLKSCRGCVGALQALRIPVPTKIIGHVQIAGTGGRVCAREFAGLPSI